ncbi:TauD/TfdA family dioxygenase [Photorhabdus temperata]|uniref:Taurine catabolism dioxygenase TauD, TfdA family n=2 Tax=Photorhabdus temperata TaxID=574560 RepID=A0A081RRW5_PHOTE|nr:TauD/TfdA family dioxygenase [Photorhabdus temperata]ERT11094.1 hypothetical protein O185_21185 [Photorhabdus temperata J3]KER01418.1 Taurine catabolism dioxygenase TauD, TfdA family [Photorhabdus temperata subsp. temperata Meg1]MCT8347867.1 TauD/TfdA family dioxygenase [Photorhabdus temperata]
MTYVKDIKPSQSENKVIKDLIDHIVFDEKLDHQYDFLEKAPIFAQELPRSIREEFYNFKRYEKYAAIHVKDNPVLLNGVQPTPTRLIELEDGYKINDAKILLGLYGSLLGEGIGFTSQRNGSIYNNIIPFEELQNVSNSSSGSNKDFGFHVEDAFHPARAEFLGLVCMRNEEKAPTTISCIDGIELTDKEKDLLFRNRFYISHNPIHSTSNIIDEEGQAILFGAKEKPYVRINAAALNLDNNSLDEINAVNKVINFFNKNKKSIVLNTSDCIFVDNFRCVHARDAYEPFFGEKARWLARVVFATDLKKSRGMRGSVQSRAIIA